MSSLQKVLAALHVLDKDASPEHAEKIMSKYMKDWAEERTDTFKQNNNDYEVLDRENPISVLLSDPEATKKFPLFIEFLGRIRVGSIDLSNQVLAKSDLSKLDFTLGLTTSGRSNFEKSDLTDINFSYSDVTNASFKNAIISNNYWQNTKIDGAQFDIEVLLEKGQNGKGFQNADRDKARYFTADGREVVEISFLGEKPPTKSWLAEQWHNVQGSFGFELDETKYVRFKDTEVWKNLYEPVALTPEPPQNLLFQFK